MPLNKSSPNQILLLRLLPPIMILFLLLFVFRPLSLPLFFLFYSFPLQLIPSVFFSFPLFSYYIFSFSSLSLCSSSSSFYFFSFRDSSKVSLLTSATLSSSFPSHFPLSTSSIPLPPPPLPPIHPPFLQKGTPPPLWTSVLCVTLNYQMARLYFRSFGGLWSTPSLPLLPGPFWPGVVIPVLCSSSLPLSTPLTPFLCSPSHDIPFFSFF